MYVRWSKADNMLNDHGLFPLATAPWLSPPRAHLPVATPELPQPRTHPLCSPSRSTLPLPATPQTLGLNHTNTVEVHVIAANDVTGCFAAGRGQFPCSESVVSGGLGATPLQTTQVGAFGVKTGRETRRNRCFPLLLCCRPDAQTMRVVANAAYVSRSGRDNITCCALCLFAVVAVTEKRRRFSESRRAPFRVSNAYKASCGPEAFQWVPLKPNNNNDRGGRSRWIFRLVLPETPFSASS